MRSLDSWLILVEEERENVMLKNYPTCQSNPENCRFVENDFVQATLMSSPVVRNRQGQPVGGGGNIVSGAVACISCDKKWTYKQTELERLQGKDVVFESY